MSHDTIRIGIVGAGGNTRGRHIPGLQALDGVSIVSVANRSRASSERAAREFSIPTVYDHWWDLVDADDTDAIVIGTWPYLHAPATIRALENGKHVLVEARMAMNFDEAETMLEVAREHPHLVAQVVPAPFTFGVDRTIQRLLAEGYVGQLLAVNAVIRGGAFFDPDAPLTWRQKRRYSGLNIMGLGIWYESLMRWVGEADSVMASGDTFGRMRPDPETGVLGVTDIPEHVDIVGDMVNGAQLHIQVSAITGLAPRTTLELFGTGGTIVLDNNILLGGRKGDTELRPLDVPDHEKGAWRVEEEFVNAIRGLEPVRFTTFEDGVRYMRFTQAVAESLTEGVRVKCSGD